MGETIKQTGNEMRERWHRKMPRFFYWVVVVVSSIGGAAVAINMGVPALGGTLHGWWTDVYSYVIGACIGIVAVCKFTVAGGYKELDPDKVMKGNIVLDKDIDHMSGERPGDPAPDEIPGD